MLMRNPTAQNFGDMARTESEDVGTKSAGGDLGWMTALQVVYEFENQAYNTAVGGISPVFKTEFGYHILMVNDKRLNRGDIKVNHILVRVMNKDESSKKRLRTWPERTAKITTAATTVVRWITSTLHSLWVMLTVNIGQIKLLL
jgi:hypothetical protein